MVMKIKLSLKLNQDHQPTSRKKTRRHMSTRRRDRPRESRKLLRETNSKSGNL